MRISVTFVGIDLPALLRKALQAGARIGYGNGIVSLTQLSFPTLIGNPEAQLG